jgi:manganese/zinc/iron transport system permease protein
LVLAIGWACPAYGLKIGDIAETDAWRQVLRFLSFQDPSVRDAVLGTALLGVCCGLLGAFTVVRKMALIGDSLSHAVLPGVAAGFLWMMRKDPLAIFVGATCAGLLGAAMVSWITETTRLKQDTAIGMVLSVFFAVGIAMIANMQRLPVGNKGGITSYLFGQASAISHTDIRLMLVVTLVVIASLVLFYRYFLMISFDWTFSTSLGLPVKLIHQGMMLLLSFSVVVGLQAVGVVLVSAMLVTPAATALLLSQKFRTVIVLSAGIGVLAAFVGTLISFMETGFPTGPFVVLASTLFFALAFLFSPSSGVVVHAFRIRSRKRRIEIENMLKGIYQVMEQEGFKGEGISIEALAKRRQLGSEKARTHAKMLETHQLAVLNEEEQRIFLTPEGWIKACSIIRKHRLWELYLTTELNVSPRDVHQDAEEIEHILGETTVRELEKRLKFPNKDPHGRLIPSIQDMWGKLGEPSGFDEGVTRPKFSRNGEEP